MADAEISELGSHRNSEDPSPGPNEARPDEAPPTLSLSALIAELVSSLQQLACRLGSEWPGSVDESGTFARARLTGDCAVDA